jgi:hypothetical protein
MLFRPQTVPTHDEADLEPMRPRTRTAIGLLGTGLGLGIWGDVLFYGRPLGLNVLLWTLAFVGALGVLLRLSHAPLHQGRRWMLLPLLLFSAAFLWHDSPLLVATNLLALAGAFAIGALRRTVPKVVQTAPGDYVAGLVAAGASAFAGSVQLLHKDVAWGDVAHSLRREKALTLGRGLALAAPLVALFGGLFMAADAVFRNLVTTAVPPLEHPFGQLVLALGVAWLAAGLLRDLLASREEARLLSPTALRDRLPPLSLAPAELGIALGALNALFFAFVLVQLRYLFGGKDLVEARAHLTYAQYARHGFFELLSVSALVLLVLLAADALLGNRHAGGRTVVRLLSAGLVALVLVVMVSALQRMRLYEQAYGLTELRLYAVGVILWLGVVFLWFSVTVLGGRRKFFAAGAVIAGFAATAALNVANPDALIARTNVDRPRIDIAYVGGLSDDAVPALLEALPNLRPDVRRALAAELLRRSQTSRDWRSFNRARSRASSLLRSHHGELVQFAASSAQSKRGADERT